ncbi:3-oxoacyl-[acyl-carrier-protein] synthase III [Kibdelosporangium banguiense]|uniref:3-oxoacyl-[acyl-carrier-protein] synthase III n=1 Tax=Kibdelosporangium banguiense TaxID=1365924 RepID=A0ABS4TW86_9PSEU|nr:ketoacyl-ACP synthase III family protein [Kibdelosporangium banguiense]MBP2328662.1 3-oxoacyl-[acyl-carrier-protein] synthase III [Kibdelosporangium banguiense]
MKLNDVHFLGLGVHLPEIVPVGWAIERGFVDPQDAARSGLLGAAVAGDLPAPDMALAAARQAIERSGQDAGSLNALLYVEAYHSGPEGWLSHSWLQRHLVGGDVFATTVNQGCNGMFGALQLAADRLTVDPSRPVLIAAADNIGSSNIDRWRCLRPDFLVGDAGSAVVLGSGGPSFARMLAIDSVTIPEYEGMLRGDEPMFPSSAALGHEVDFTSRQEEFEKATPGHEIGMAVVRTREVLLDRLLADAGIAMGQISRVAYNHGSRDFVESGLMAMLGLPLERSTWEFGRGVGHLSVSDHLIAIEHLLTTGELRPGDHLLMLGMGPGINIAGAVLELTDVPAWAG